MKRKILVLAPHTDDGEFGCGGTINKFLKGGDDLFYAAFSLAEESVPPPFPKNILETEVRAAIGVLGIPVENLLLYKYRVRHFASHRQEILEDLVYLSKNIKPDLVFMPATHDLHQDHSTLSIEGFRAFKGTSILCYELPWNNLNFATQAFVKLEQEHIDIKIRALSCYESQQQKLYASPEFIRSLAVTRGVQVGSHYAEVFEVVRWIL